MIYTIRRFLIVLLFACFSSCMEIETTGCSVPYNIKSGNNEIYNTWGLVAFRNKSSGNLDYPPCELYINEGGQVELGRIRITFTTEPSLQEDAEGFLRFFGAGPVNSFFGEYKLSDNRSIESTSRIGTTLMASVYPSVMEYESRLYAALSQLSQYHIRNNVLRITFGEGKEEMVWVLLDPNN